MSDTDKYEGLIDAEGYIDYDGIDILLSEVKRLREIIMEASYDLEWYPDRLNQVKRMLKYNVKKWEMIE